MPSACNKSIVPQFLLGLAERGGRIHLQTIENAKAITIRPVLEAKLRAGSN